MSTAITGASLISVTSKTSGYKITLQVGQGPAGPKGDPSVFNAAQMLSQDAAQKATTGTDGKLLVPDSPLDPLAYYMLAKA